MKIYKLLAVLLCVLTQSCAGQNQKINGLSFVASPYPINNSHIDPVLHITANYCAIMPFGFI